MRFFLKNYGFLVFALAIAIVTARFATLFGGSAYVSDALWGMADFRDAIYYPVRALIDGVNPYDTPAMFEIYPVGQHFPLYPPLHLLINLPFGLLDFGLAWKAYYALTVALYAAIVYIGLRHWHAAPRLNTLFLIAGALVLTRPAMMNLHLGQPSIEAVAATVLALVSLRRHPALVLLGTTAALAKPTFGVPLLVLLWALREYRIVGLTLALSAAINALMLVPAINAAGGIGSLLEAAWFNNFWFHQDTSPLGDYSRVDALALISRTWGTELGGLWEPVLFGVLMAPAAWWLRTNQPSGAPLGLDSLLIGCLAILLAAYHQTYDALLLVLPLIGMLIESRRARGMDRWNWALAGLLLTPFVNYVSTHTTVTLLAAYLPETMLVKLVYSINAAALLLAYGAAIWRVRRRS